MILGEAIAVYSERLSKPMKSHRVQNAGILMSRYVVSCQLLSKDAAPRI
jgi:hypothetical protein